MSQENVEMVRRGIEAYARGDLSTALEGLDPDVEWNPAEESGFRGVAAVRSYLEQWRQAWDDYEMRAQEYIDAVDRVFVTLYFRGRGKASGIETEARSHHVYTLRAGKTVKLVEYLDRDQALRAAGLLE
jgi:ketosteroid isomerase-like protein